MKVSTIILATTLFFLLLAMVVSNILLKREYDKIDKSDIYWNYERIIDKPFHHLNVQGGNLTNIGVEESNRYSVRIFKNWSGLKENRVKAHVVNDTLFITFPKSPADQYEKEYIQRMTLVRVFSPKLKSAKAINSNLHMLKSHQKSFHIDLSGRSNFEVDSYVHNFDSLTISQSDSSRVVFRMSVDLKTKERLAESQSWEAFNIDYLHAQIRGVSILDLGHAQIKELQLDVADTSAVILSGSGLKRFASVQ